MRNCNTQSIFEQLQAAESKKLILQLQVKTWPHPTRHSQVWYIQFRDDTTQKQISQLRDYLEHYSSEVDYTEPLGADILRVYIK